MSSRPSPMASYVGLKKLLLLTTLRSTSRVHSMYRQPLRPLLAFVCYVSVFCLVMLQRFQCALGDSDTCLRGCTASRVPTSYMHTPVHICLVHSGFITSPLCSLV